MTAAVPDDEMLAGGLSHRTKAFGAARIRAGEIADALAFLGSDAASYTNGTNLLIDNGFSAAIPTNQIDCRLSMR